MPREPTPGHTDLVLATGEAAGRNHPAGTSFWRIISFRMNDPDDTRPSWRQEGTPPPPDPDAPTRLSVPARPDEPGDSLSNYQAIRITPSAAPPPPVEPPSLPPPPPPPEAPPAPAPRRRRGCGCFLVLLGALALLAAYIVFPIRTNAVLIGIDTRVPGETAGRSDTLIVLGLKPIDRSAALLSIPRDLWVSIPGVGENRINTAHYFAELEAPGSGPAAVKQVVQANFGIEVDYYVRASFDSFKQLIDALGGVEITLDQPMGGYPAGTHLLNADQALAFARDRTSGGDDFARMAQTQVMVRALVQTALAPAHRARLPELARIALEGVDTDIPVFWRPRLAVGLLLALPDGLDTRVITREMTSPFTTAQGAQVLGPRWDVILPLVQEMFAK